MEQTIKIEGMHCSGCAARVKNALNSIPGVRDVSVDLNAKSATIFADAPLDLSLLAEKIDLLGFTLVTE